MRSSLAFGCFATLMAASAPAGASASPQVNAVLPTRMLQQSTGLPSVAVGQGFGATTGTVHFSGVSCAVTSWSDAAVSFELPQTSSAQAGTVSVCTTASACVDVAYEQAEAQVAGYHDYSLSEVRDLVQDLTSNPDWEPPASLYDDDSRERVLWAYRHELMEGAVFAELQAAPEEVGLTLYFGAQMQYLDSLECFDFGNGNALVGSVTTLDVRTAAGSPGIRGASLGETRAAREGVREASEAALNTQVGCFTAGQAQEWLTVGSLSQAAAFSASLPGWTFFDDMNDPSLPLPVPVLDGDAGALEWLFANRLIKEARCGTANVVCANGQVTELILVPSNPSNPGPSLAEIEYNIRPFKNTLRKFALGVNGFTTGTIPTGFNADYYVLQEIRLSANQIYGTLPPSLGAMPVLSTLTFNENLIHGSIPGALFSGVELRQIRGSFNIMDSIEDGYTFPENSKLRVLQLNNNELQGTLPAAWGAGVPSDLWELSLRRNYLTGNIPEYPSSMKFLDLGVNKLSGWDGPRTCLRTGITLCAVNNNPLQCPFPDATCEEECNASPCRTTPAPAPTFNPATTKIHPIQERALLRLQNNAGRAFVPGWDPIIPCDDNVQCNLAPSGRIMITGLKLRLGARTDISINTLLNLVPVFQGNLRKLEIYTLTEAGVTIDPVQLLDNPLIELQRLTHLNVSGTSIIGTIPNVVSRLPELYSLDLSFNGLTSAPIGLGRMPKVERLFLNDNSFTMLPAIWPAPEALIVDLSNNNLEGFPRFLCDIPDPDVVLVEVTCNMENSGTWFERGDLSPCRETCNLVNEYICRRCLDFREVSSLVPTPSPSPTPDAMTPYVDYVYILITVYQYNYLYWTIDQYNELVYYIVTVYYVTAEQITIRIYLSDGSTQDNNFELADGVTALAVEVIVGTNNVVELLAVVERSSVTFQSELSTVFGDVVVEDVYSVHCGTTPELPCPAGEPAADRNLLIGLASVGAFFAMVAAAAMCRKFRRTAVVAPKPHEIEMTPNPAIGMEVNMSV